MVNYVIVPAQKWHCNMLAPVMRPAEVREMMLAGQTPMEGLLFSLGWSLVAKSVFVDGEIAMMFGLAGEMAQDDGVAWCLTSDHIRKVPFSFAREARRELGKWLEIKKKVYAYVGKEYDCAQRFWRLMGFSVDNSQTLWTADFQMLSIGRV